jgi:Asp-tRNA(Asn)/Glu-tRNA(Gln) amidotransferase A subunit family amidase
MVSTGIDGKQDAAWGAFVAFARPDAVATPGPLADMRIAVKDNIAVAGLPFTAGVPMFRHRVATRDAVAVSLLRAAGASIVGVTRTDAGGLGVVTPEVTNPIAPDAIVGGSSGGSAAAVAGGYAEIGLGTDTGGSVRIPAACCRLFGFKPSHGRVPGTDVWPLARELEDIGVMATRLSTLVAAAHVLLQSAPNRPTPERRFAIGIDSGRLAACDPVVARSFERSMQRLERAGCELREVRLPAHATVSRAHGILVLEAAKAVYAEASREGGNAGLGTTIQRALELAQQHTPADIADAARIRESMRQMWNATMTQCDYVAMPTLPVPVPKRGTRRVRLGGADLPMSLALTAETSLANLVGVPALAMPPAHESESLQLIGAAGEDSQLLSDAAHLHAMLGAP